MQLKYLSATAAVLCFAVCGAVCLGTLDVFVKTLPFAGLGCATAVCIGAAAAIMLAQKHRRIFFNAGVCMALCLLAFCAIRFSIAQQTALVSYPQSSLYFCYYIVILLYASSETPLLGILAASVLIAGESATLWFAGSFKDCFAQWENGGQQLFLTRLQLILFPFLSMALSALVPFFMVRFGRNPYLLRRITRMQIKTQQPAPPPKTTTIKPSLETRQRTHVPPTNKTQIVQLDQDTSAIVKTDINEVLASVVYFMSRNFKAYSALGFVFDPMRSTFVLNSFHSKHIGIRKGFEIQEGHGVVGRIGTTRTSFLSGDLSLYPQELLYYQAHENINSVLAVPILSDTKELLGALVIDSQDKNSFTEQHKETMRRFSSLAAALITNVRMRIFQEKAAKSFQIFYEASQQFVTALHSSQVFDVLFHMVSLLVPESRMMIVTFNEQKKCAVVAKLSAPYVDISEGYEFPVNAGLYAYVFQKRQIVNIGNYQVYKGKYYRFVPNEPFPTQLASLVILPILDDEQRIIGLFSIESETVDQFTGDTEKYLSTIVGNASVAITRARLYQKMEMLATTDGLTQLFNHRTFQDYLAREVERSKRYQRPLSLLLMDIDHFKSFNDTYGHPVCDLVLKEISACIRQSLRVNDIPSRYGGEEFTVIIPESDEATAILIAERIRRTVEEHVIVSLDKRLHVTISIGCATMPVHAQTGHELVDCADKALYFSKEHGRNKVTVFTMEMKGKNTN